MPKHTSNEDLFKGSTMTFGEHLEELRVCLFKALLGLVVGSVVGLMIGWWVVERIQGPLKDALTTHYQAETERKLKEEIARRQAADEQLPPGADHYIELIADAGLLPEQAYVYPPEILGQLKARYPKRLAGVEMPPVDPKEEISEKDLIPVFFWHRIQDDKRIRVTALSVHEAFTIYIKASLLVGVVLASPWIFYQIWSFVAAGLYHHEKKYIHVFLPFSLGLFLLGAALAFCFVFKPVLNFLFGFNQMLGIDPDPRISEWLGFVLVLPLGFGVSFQLPLVMLFLERIGIFTVEAYLSKVRVAILVIFVLAMFLTPADPYSMLLMAVPLTFLYYGGILLCRFLPRSRNGV